MRARMWWMRFPWALFAARPQYGHVNIVLPRPSRVYRPDKTMLVILFLHRFLSIFLTSPLMRCGAQELGSGAAPSDTSVGDYLVQ